MRLGRGQATLGLEGLNVKVSTSQFYGIEINDFAVNVAATALKIAELQANQESEGVIERVIEGLPLADNANIVRANALTCDWQQLLPAGRCSYVMGNPPFLGARNQSTGQKAELMALFAGAKRAGDIDYVTGWYMQAARYMLVNPHIQAAFVSTNSLTQGVQAANVWAPLFAMGVGIDFAHRTFRWTSEGPAPAHVFVVVIGFSVRVKGSCVTGSCNLTHGDDVSSDTSLPVATDSQEDSTCVKLHDPVTHDPVADDLGPKRLWSYATRDSPPTLSHPSQINAYLLDAPPTFVYARKQPISDVPRMGIGNQPIDGGNYLFSAEERLEFLAREPGAEPFFRRWLGSDEFINGRQRWVLWLGQATRAELRGLPLSQARVEAVRRFRLESKRAQTVKLAERPTHFLVENMPEGTSVLVPEVSSERRYYIPIGFVGPDTLCSNLVRLIPGADLYHLGVLTSRAHNAWMRVVAGRLKSDYRYSAELVYNNFVWPDADAAQRQQLAGLAQAMLDARDLYPDCTLADLYDPNYMPDPRRQAHQSIDRAVERLYGLNPNLDEPALVAHLLALHAEVA
jgi:hypothetical protein